MGYRQSDYFYNFADKKMPLLRHFGGLSKINFAGH